ncbi:MAG: 50S ribosomal protein L25 [Elusimicrobia bacterium]|nr:50S ribosomal protein L25 [Elusimicrobiota bacterium]
MEQLTVSAQLRDKIGGKGGLSALRSQGVIPAVIYGLKQPSVAVVVVEKEMLGIMKKGANAVLKLKYSGKEDNVIIKEVQRHVVTDKPIHIDFHRISLTEKIEVKVHIKIVGEAFGVKTEGGILEHSLREFNVLCMPVDIPKEIEVNVTELKLGESIRVKDVKSEKAEILDDPSHLIVTVVMPKEEVVETPVAAVGAVAGAAEAEPELVGGKGKKEEEGEEGAAEGAAPGAKPAQPGAKPAQPVAKPAEKKAEPKK